MVVSPLGRQTVPRNNGAVWIVGKLLGNPDKAFGQTRISELSAAEFTFPPRCALILRQRWYDSYRGREEDFGNPRKCKGTY